MEVIDTIFNIYLLGVIVAVVMNLLYCPIRLLVKSERAEFIRSEILKGNGNVLVFNFFVPFFVTTFILGFISWLGVIYLILGFATINNNH